MQPNPINENKAFLTYLILNLTASWGHNSTQQKQVIHFLLSHFGIFPFFISNGGVIAPTGQLVQQVEQSLHSSLLNLTVALNMVFPR